jgi:hypothetical protein
MCLFLKVQLRSPSFLLRFLSPEILIPTYSLTGAPLCLSCVRVVVYGSVLTILFLFSPGIPRIEPRALLVLVTHSTIQLHPSPWYFLVERSQHFFG